MHTHLGPTVPVPPTVATPVPLICSSPASWAKLLRQRRSPPWNAVLVPGSLAVTDPLNGPAVNKLGSATHNPEPSRLDAPSAPALAPLEREQLRGPCGPIPSDKLGALVQLSLQTKTWEGSCKPMCFIYRDTRAATYQVYFFFLREKLATVRSSILRPQKYQPFRRL